MADVPALHHRMLVKGRLGALRLDADVTFATPWTVLFGPSGSGKTSLLRALCGLLGHGISVNFDRFVEGDWKSLRALAPHRRALAYASQQGAVFPHLTVRGNLIFPTDVRPHGMTRAPNNPSRKLIDESIALFELEPLLERMPQMLSGGELRRVALARAFAVPKTQLMLLDEPFAGLDRGLRDRLLPQMKDWLARRSIPVISVTHDVDEAFLLGAEVVRVEQGRTTEQGPAREVLMKERVRLLETLG